MPSNISKQEILSRRLKKLIMRIKEKALEIYKKKGISGLFYSILRKICHFIFETNSHNWLIRNLDSNEIEIKPDIPLIIEFYNFQETLNWIRNQNMPWMNNRREEEIAIKERHYWGSAKYNGKIIGYIKVGFKKVFINDYKKSIEFPQDVVFLYDMYVTPEFRSKKVAVYLLNEASRFSKNIGFSKALAYAPDWNIPSMKSLTKAGLKREKKIRYIQIFGVKILTANPGNL